MIKLKKLLLENWVEDFKEKEYNISLNDIKKISEEYKLSTQFKLKNNIICISDESESIELYFLKDLNTNYYDLIASTKDELENWITDVSINTIQEIIYPVSEENIGNPWIDDGLSIKQLKENSVKLYHYTSEENWDDIQAEKILKMSYGTSLTNRGTFGIFCTTDPETYADGTYGNICLEIDINEFKNGENIKDINLEYEPDVEDYLLRSYLIYNLSHENISEDIIYVPSDVSMNTIIIGHNIPIQYIKQLD